MAVRRISSFDGARTADELLNLSTPKLAEIVLQHLKSYEGTHTIMQNGMVHRRYFIGMAEGRNMGLGISNTKPEYGARQPTVLDETNQGLYVLLSPTGKALFIPRSNVSSILFGSREDLPKKT
jgi:hypothetical protein